MSEGKRKEEMEKMELVERWLNVPPEIRKKVVSKAIRGIYIEKESILRWCAEHKVKIDGNDCTDFIDKTSILQCAQQRLKAAVEFAEILMQEGTLQGQIDDLKSLNKVVTSKNGTIIAIDKPEWIMVVDINHPYANYSQVMDKDGAFWIYEGQIKDKVFYVREDHSNDNVREVCDTLIAIGDVSEDFERVVQMGALEHVRTTEDVRTICERIRPRLLHQQLNPIIPEIPTYEDTTVEFEENGTKYVITVKDKKVFVTMGQKTVRVRADLLSKTYRIDKQVEYVIEAAKAKLQPKRRTGKNDNMGRFTNVESYTIYTGGGRIVIFSAKQGKTYVLGLSTTHDPTPENSVVLLRSPKRRCVGMAQVVYEIIPNYYRAAYVEIDGFPKFIKRIYEQAKKVAEKYGDTVEIETPVEKVKSIVLLGVL